MNVLQRRAWGLWRVLLVGAVLGVLTPVRVYPDSINYLISAKSLFSSDFASDYFWLREPLYPMFLRGMIELPPSVSLHLIPMIQGMSLAAGLWLFAVTAKSVGILRREEPAAYYAFTCLLITGYSGVLLQQTFMVLAAGSLAYFAMRLATTPLDRRLLVGSGLAATFAVMLSSIFLVAVALLPFAAFVVRRPRSGWLPFAVIWGSGGLATALWMVIRLANGQAFGPGGAAVLSKSNVTDWPLRVQAFLATFGLAPDFFDGVAFNTLSYSNVAISLNAYFGGIPCVESDLVDLNSMPNTYLVCGSTLAPNLPPSLLQPITTVALLQVVIGAIAVVWAWSATSNVRAYAFVLILTALPCLQVAIFFAQGNSRYGLPVLALSLILTTGMASRAYDSVRDFMRTHAASQRRATSRSTP